MARTDSRQVSFLAVHEFVAPVLAQVNNSWPMLGTPAWCLLAHNDPRTWAAVFDGAQHYALRLELDQEAMVDASQTISTAEDWPAIAREFQQINEFRTARPWMRRAVR
jgi:hypothetical protein